MNINKHASFSPLYTTPHIFINITLILFGSYYRVVSCISLVFICGLFFCCGCLLFSCAYYACVGALWLVCDSLILCLLVLLVLFVVAVYLLV